MTYTIVAASSLLAVLLALAWCREFRLRRALQNLLARIFAFWRNASLKIGPPDSCPQPLSVTIHSKLRLLE
jgi:hypothetical protein